MSRQLLYTGIYSLDYILDMIVYKSTVRDVLVGEIWDGFLSDIKNGKVSVKHDAKHFDELAGSRYITDITPSSGGQAVVVGIFDKEPDNE